MLHTALQRYAMWYVYDKNGGNQVSAVFATNFYIDLLFHLVAVDKVLVPEIHFTVHDDGVCPDFAA